MLRLVLKRHPSTISDLQLILQLILQLTLQLLIIASLCVHQESPHVYLKPFSPNTGARASPRR